MDSARLLTVKADLEALTVRISRLQNREYLAPFEKREIIRLQAEQRRLQRVIAQSETKQMRLI